MAAFKVMTWNVENLFQPGDIVSDFPKPKRMEETTYREKLDYLASQINEVKPHILVLQELGGSREDVTKTLDDLNTRLQDRFANHAISSHADSRHIRVALLSQIPIASDRTVVGFADGELASVPNWFPSPPVTEMGRGALLVEVEPAEGVRVRVITAHLKSKLVSYRRDQGDNPFEPHDPNERAIGLGLALLRRTAEAVTLRVLLNDLMPSSGSHTLLLGDMNDEPKAATSQILLGFEDKDITRSDKHDVTRLYNLLGPISGPGGIENDTWFLSEDERYTRIYEGQGEIIDHIYASRGLLGDDDSFRAGIWKVKEVRSLVDDIRGQSVGDDASKRLGKAVPDHAPVYATFDL